MAPITKKAWLWWAFTRLVAIRARKRRLYRFLFLVLRKRRIQRIIMSHLLFQIHIIEESNVERVRSVRRLGRNSGWFELVWLDYDDARFKKTFRISRQTFQYVLEFIRADITKDEVTETPISPECRLAVCLYRLARGDYLYTVSELFGIGLATVHAIVEEVCAAIIKNLWKASVLIHFPVSEQQFSEAIVDMEQLWQFPLCFGAIDGCHLPLQCPNGGEEAAKEYHNFKNFYSIVMLAIVDASARIIWMSVGFPGNSHDSIIFQATSLWDDISHKRIIPPLCQEIDGEMVGPMILGDSAFPFRTWLMKPFPFETLRDEQSYFNYRLSRARMVTERAFGLLKSRWRILYRKSSCQPDRLKQLSMACVVLHNICINRGDKLPQYLDLAEDPATNCRRSRQEVRELLHMRNCSPAQDNNRLAENIRRALMKKFMQEKNSVSQ